VWHEKRAVGTSSITRQVGKVSQTEWEEEKKERGSISNGRNIKEDTKASKRKRKRKQERTSPSLPHLLD